MSSNKNTARRNSDAQHGKQTRNPQEHERHAREQDLRHELKGRSNDLHYPDWGDTTGMTGQP